MLVSLMVHCLAIQHTVTVEAVLGEASKSFVQDILDEEEAEQNIVNEAHDALDEALADGSSPDEK